MCQRRDGVLAGTEVEICVTATAGKVSLNALSCWRDYLARSGTVAANETHFA
jgi:hypothetical protein